MKTTFNAFIKLYEQQQSIISLLDLENMFKKVFSKAKLQSIKSVYEKNDDGLKLIFSINNLFFEKCNIIHTKFIFYVDNDKTKLIKNNFKYLYDINCEYVEVSFDDIISLEKILKNIIKEKKFGNIISDISNIFVSMSTDINNKLKENNIDNISIYNVSYSPFVDIVPCDAFSMDFDININNVENIKMNIKKINNTTFKYSFKHDDWFESITKSDIKATNDTIVEILKNNFL